LGAFAQVITPGSVIAIFGTNLAATSVAASATPLPVTLGGASGLVNGSLKVPLFYVSPSQRYSVQFRMERLNAPNHVEWDTPVTGWGSSNKAAASNFGQITSTRANMRQIQFPLKYNF
jgi:uncharacterized protein (TIGR03437 family)